MRYLNFKYLSIALLLGLALLRLVDLGADPPLFYVGHGDGQLTDPFHITHFARNFVLFDDANPFDYNRWNIFKGSLVSLMSLLLFSIVGVSRTVANLSAVFLSLGGSLFFLGGLYKRWSDSKLLLAGFLLLINSTLFYYGRLPFLENGLIFISGLLFFVFVRYHNHLWGQLLIGLIVAMAALAGKLFGFVLIGPVMLALMFRYRKNIFKPALTVVGGLISGIVIYLFVFYDGSVAELISYYGEQTGGMYGPPPGFGSPVDFIKMLLTYGGESGLWEYTPIMFLLTLASLLLILLILPPLRKPDDKYLPLIFVIGWLMCGVFGLMPFQYRPLRYALFLYLPISAIGAYAIGFVLDKASRPKIFPKLGYMRATLFFLTLWYLMVQSWMYLAPFGSKFKSGMAAIPLAALISVVVTAFIFIIFRKGKIKFPTRSISISFLTIFVGVMIYQGGYLYRGMRNRNHQLSQYSHELAQALGPGAVLTGPFGATLTVDNNLKNVIYMFGLANIETGLFDKFPITHVAADNGNWKVGQKDFPQLNSAINITQLYIRNSFIDIFRLSTATSPATDFELGSIWISRGRPDSAYNYYKRFSIAYPDNRVAQKHLAYAALFKGSVDEAVSIIERIQNENPDNYVTHEICKYFYAKAFEVTKNQKFNSLKNQHIRISTELRD